MVHSRKKNLTPVDPSTVQAPRDPSGHGACGGLPSIMIRVLHQGVPQRRPSHVSSTGLLADRFPPSCRNFAGHHVSGGVTVPRFLFVYRITPSPIAELRRHPRSRGVTSHLQQGIAYTVRERGAKGALRSTKLASHPGSGGVRAVFQPWLVILAPAGLARLH